MIVKEIPPAPVAPPPRRFQIEIGNCEATILKALLGRTGPAEERAILGAPAGTEARLAADMYLALEAAGVEHTTGRIEVMAVR